MSFKAELAAGIERAIKEKKFRSVSELADQSGTQQASLSRFLNKHTGLTLDSVEKLANVLGCRLVFEEKQDTGRDVVFVEPQIVNAKAGPPPAHEDYLAVPLAAGHVAAGPGLIPEDRIRSFILVWKHHDAVRFRRNLVAVEIGRGETSMEPTLHSGDIVLVDRDDCVPEPDGKIMLVMDPGPDADAAIKRVATQARNGGTELVFYSDNGKLHPPRTHSLDRDYDGDLHRAIAGRVVWAWSDCTKK